MPSANYNTLFTTIPIHCERNIHNHSFKSMLNDNTFALYIYKCINHT